MRTVRYIFQLAVLGGAVSLMLRGMNGLTLNTCETYCPFGGVAALYPLIRHRGYTCALSEMNVAMLVSLVVLTLVAKKSFCSWVCPLGTIQEWLGRLSRRLFGRWFHIPSGIDRRLVGLRYVVVVLVLGLTWTVWQGDLGFRAYDPFYILFTWGGHETLRWSFLVVIGVLGIAVVVPMFWCRYLCPLGAVMDPMSRAGVLRIRRDASACTDCGVCDAVCPHRIPVSSVDEVTARNCTNCLECVAECPERGALSISLCGK